MVKIFEIKRQLKYCYQIDRTFNYVGWVTNDIINKTKQFLKGLAHHLNPVVMLGTNGLTEGFS